VDYALLGGFITWLGGHLWLNSFLLYLWAPNTLPPSSDSLRSGLQMDIIALKLLMPPTCHPGCHSPWPILSMCEGMEWVRAMGLWKAPQGHLLRARALVPGEWPGAGRRPRRSARNAGPASTGSRSSGSQ
jgi:hypothetical protein